MVCHVSSTLLSAATSENAEAAYGPTRPFQKSYGYPYDFWNGLVGPYAASAFSEVAALNRVDDTWQTMQLDHLVQGKRKLAEICENPRCERWLIRMVKPGSELYDRAAQLLGQPTQNDKFGFTDKGPSLVMSSCEGCRAKYCSRFCLMVHWKGSYHSGGNQGAHSHKPHCMRIRALLEARRLAALDDDGPEVQVDSD